MRMNILQFVLESRLAVFSIFQGMKIFNLIYDFVTSLGFETNTLMKFVWKEERDGGCLSALLDNALTITRITFYNRV